MTFEVKAYLIRRISLELRDLKSKLDYQDWKVILRWIFEAESTLTRVEILKTLIVVIKLIKDEYPTRLSLLKALKDLTNFPLKVLARIIPVYK